MAEIQLPWFLACEHTSDTTALIGEGAFSAVPTDSSVVLVSGYRALQLYTASAHRFTPPSTNMALGVRLIYLANSGAAVSCHTLTGSEIVSLYNNSGILEIRRGGTVVGVSGRSIAQMRYAELRVKLGGAGQDAVRLVVDGADALSLTGLSLGTGPIERVQYGGWTLQTHWYIRDATGLDNPFYGPILPRFLNAESDILAQWTRAGAASNAAAVQAPHPTTAPTRYVETQTLGQRDEYQTIDLPPDVNSIIAVVRCTVSSAPSGGAPQIQQGVRTSGGTIMGPERMVGVSGFRTQLAHALTEKPGGGGWSRAAVNELVLIREAV